jgi:hypothetical protein
MSQVFEDELNSAYLDFYQKLDALAKVNASTASFSKTQLARLFQQHCLFLYFEILIAFKETLVDAGLPISEAIRRLFDIAETTFATTDYERLVELSQRAGFVGAQSLPEILIAVIPENARGKTSKLIWRLEKQLRGLSVSIDPAAEIYHEETPTSIGQHERAIMLKLREASAVRAPTDSPPNELSRAALDNDPAGVQHTAPDVQNAGHPQKSTSEVSGAPVRVVGSAAREHQAKSAASAEPDLARGAPDLWERKAAYEDYKRACKAKGVRMSEVKLARLARSTWHTRDPVMKWKAGKDRPGDDDRIRQAMRRGPPPADA